jgi:alpha-L-rhamnosidase/Glycosyl hydrolases family 2, sugar binding domain
MESVVTALDRVSPADFRVEQGQRDRILYSHRTKYGADVYWVVNDSEQPRNIVVSVAAQGQPEIWDPETGERHPTSYWVHDDRTYVPLEFNAWDAGYLVLAKTDSKAPSVTISATNLSGYTIKQQPSGNIVVDGTLPATATRAFVEGSVGGTGFHNTSTNTKPAQIQVLPDDGWAFRLDSHQVPVRYARATRVAPGDGESAGFIRNNYNDQLWSLAPLSGEQFSFRNWWVIGPFPNPDKTGFNVAYPPEQKFNADARYDGALGERITWRKYHSDSNQVDLRRAFGTDDKGVGYAATWVYSPKEEHARAVFLGKNAKLWVNQKLVFGLFTNSWYYEFREPFSYDPEVQLKAGWNEILVKVASGDSGPNLVFSLHFNSTDGEPLTNLTENWQPEKSSVVDLSEDDGQPQGSDLWYRVEAPVGAEFLDVDHPEQVAAMYADERPLEVTKHIAIPPLPDQLGPRVLAIKMSTGQVLTKPLRFETGETKLRLGSWTRTGLTYFSGSAIYERDFQLNSDLLGKQIFIDLGQVGVVAEIWMNGQHVTDRLWEPFRADVTKYVKPGKNTLQIIVTNSSDAANRALPDFARYMEFVPLGGEYAYLDKTGPNGLIGPVRLMPYDQIQVAVKP